MPIHRCMKNGSPGYRWGKQGKCYTYRPGSDKSRKRARRKAFNQGMAIEGPKKARRAQKRSKRR